MLDSLKTWLNTRSIVKENFVLVLRDVLKEGKADESLLHQAVQPIRALVSLLLCNECVRLTQRSVHPNLPRRIPLSAFFTRKHIMIEI
jgi:hypothetical protein